MIYKTQLDFNLLFYNLPIYNKPTKWKSSQIQLMTTLA
jgi:hypothetical protein